jgi:hypothetical protein
LHDDVRSGEHACAIGRYFRALRRVIGVSEAGFQACPGLDHHFQTGFGQDRQNQWHQGHTALSRKTLFRHTHNHGSGILFFFSIPAASR